MYFLITTVIYFIAIIFINVSGAPDIVWNINTSTREKSYRNQLNFNTGYKLDLVLTVLDFSPITSFAVHVTYEKDGGGDRTKTEVYTGRRVHVSKIMEDVDSRVLVKVEWNSTTGLCSEKILEATHEYTYGNNNMMRCVRCRRSKYYSPGSCQDISYELRCTATRYSPSRDGEPKGKHIVKRDNGCYGNNCNKMGNETRHIFELFYEQKQNDISKPISYFTELLKSSSPTTANVSDDIDFKTFETPQIEVPDIEIPQTELHNITVANLLQKEIASDTTTSEEGFITVPQQTITSDTTTSEKEKPPSQITSDTTTSEKDIPQKEITTVKTTSEKGFINIPQKGINENELPSLGFSFSPSMALILLVSTITTLFTSFR